MQNHNFMRYSSVKEKNEVTIFVQLLRRTDQYMYTLQEENFLHCVDISPKSVFSNATSCK